MLKEQLRSLILDACGELTETRVHIDKALTRLNVALRSLDGEVSPTVATAAASVIEGGGGPGTEV